MDESVELLGALRRRIARIEGGAREHRVRLFETGHAGIDAALGGGLARGRVHEVFAAEPDDAGSATGFAAMLALSAQPPGAVVLWIECDAGSRGRRFHAPGFAELGGNPDSVVLAIAPDDVALLRCARDAARCEGLGAIVIECRGNPRALDLTASRKLALTVEQSGAVALLLRIAAEPSPSAADTRWSVRAAPSVSFEAEAPGLPMLDIELLRRRAGLAGMRWRVEWNRDRHLFREPPLSGAVVPLPADRQAASRRATRLLDAA